MSKQILQLESKIDPKAIFNKSIKVKPKTKFYSGVRILLIGVLVFLSIILSSLAIGANFLEINNPNFNNEGFGKILSTTNQEPTLSLSEILDSKPSIPTQKQFPSDQPYLIIILQGFTVVVAEITSLILGYSLEFLMIGVFLLITCYWVYRITDWPLTNNKPLLLALILVLTISIGLGFLTIFKEDRRIPRLLRETRDMIRETINFGQKE
jgi:ABC-type multidrug transport system fused ATPase/permease subunit